ncbi:MAG: hypothetical protein HY657_17675 [Acidobacteria bacterium]|nr:hypothetical protein [Acidobacteriota bacterium]
MAAWPTSAFFTPKKTMYFNGEPIEILHMPSARTDGDVVVHFRGSDVIAAGDAFSTDRFPQFDPARGGSIQGAIDALNRIIDITVPEFNMQGGTLVIPGRGRGANAPPAPQRGGSLRVETTGMRPGYLRKNGLPYSENATMTEYFFTHRAPDGNQWLTVTQLVRDPKYLTQELRLELAL